MKAMLALLGRLAVETRLFLGLSAVALFAFAWLFVFAVSKGETRRPGRIPEMVTSGELEMQFWRANPFLFLPILAWGIARGSSIVGKEVERGTMDLVLSRPVSRGTYFSSQVILALAGMVLLWAALVAGNAAGNRFNVLRSPPTLLAVVRPALNLSMLGLAAFGYAALLSSIDRVGWRPNLIASSITFAAFVAWVVSGILARFDGLEAWSKGLKRASIFSAYDPVDALMKPETLGPNLAILGGIGAAGIVLGFLIFLRRDLPTSG